MSKVDTAWLRMETPTNLMMIVGVILLEGTLEMDGLKTVIEQRFLRFSRFRKKAIDRNSGAYWHYDTGFDIDHHLRRVKLTGKAGRQELQALVSELASTALDEGKPRWQFHWVDNYHGDGHALICRIHHCYADGIALIQVLLSMTDTTPSASSVIEPSLTPRPASPTISVDRLYRSLQSSVDYVAKLGRKALAEGVNLVRDPMRATRHVRDVGTLLGDLYATLTLSDDSPTQLKGPLSARKQVAWCEPIALAEVKALSKAFTCTVNDILIAAATGVIRSYLIARGALLENALIRATVPVNLRPRSQDRELGNHFGLVFLDLPVNEDNPLSRLYRVQENMNGLKRSKQATVAFGMLAALGMAPRSMQQFALQVLSRKASTVLTNVPGPRDALYLAGARIAQQMFWVPQTGSIGMGISILSYDNQVQVGLIADASRVPDPENMMQRFGTEFEKIVMLALLAPWDRRPTAEQAEAIVAGAPGP